MMHTYCLSNKIYFCNIGFPIGPLCIEWTCHLCTCHLFCWPKVSLKNSATFFICTLTLQIPVNIAEYEFHFTLDWEWNSVDVIESQLIMRKKEKKYICRYICKIRIETIWCRISQSWKLFVCNVSRGCKSFLLHLSLRTI